MLRESRLVIVFVLSTFVCLPGLASEFDFAVSSYLGESGFDDSISGACIQSDGTIVLAGNLGPNVRKKLGLDSPLAGCVIHLDADGRKVLSARGVAALVNDLAVDGSGNLYVAVDAAGLVKLSPDGASTIWTATPGKVVRVAAGRDGTAACIVERTVHIFDAGGKSLGTAAGGQYTCDVCVDSDSKTVIQTGFRNAHAFDGKKTYPVQIRAIQETPADPRNEKDGPKDGFFAVVGDK